MRRHYGDFASINSDFYQASQQVWDISGNYFLRNNWGNCLSRRVERVDGRTIYVESMPDDGGCVKSASDPAARRPSFGVNRVETRSSPGYGWPPSTSVPTAGASMEAGELEAEKHARYILSVEKVGFPWRSIVFVPVYFSVGCCRRVEEIESVFLLLFPSFSALWVSLNPAWLNRGSLLTEEG